MFVPGEVSPGLSILIGYTSLCQLHSSWALLSPYEDVYSCQPNSTYIRLSSLVGEALCVYLLKLKEDISHCKLTSPVTSKRPQTSSKNDP